MAIVIENLTKSYGEKLALPPFSCTLEEGEIVCLLGQSGCGKTTLLRLLLGLETPTGGTVTGLPDRISAVFQEDRLCPAFSAVTNVSLALGRQVPRAEISATRSKSPSGSSAAACSGGWPWPGASFLPRTST